MTEHKLRIQANTVGELINTLNALAELRMISSEEVAKADFRAIALRREDLADDLYGLPDPSLGLTEYEAGVLVTVADEFLRNAYRALDAADDPEGNFNHAAPGFIAASRLGLAAAELGIEFDDVLGAGEISVSHPIIEDLTPPLDLATVRRTRPQQFRRGRSTRGAIYEIEDGAIHSMLKHTGLEHSQVEAEDNTGEGGIQHRTVRFRFQRKT